MYHSKNDTCFVAIGARDKRSRGGNDKSDMVVLHMNIEFYKSPEGEALRQKCMNYLVVRDNSFSSTIVAGKFC